MSNSPLARKATFAAVADGGLARVNQTGTAGADTLTGGPDADTLTGLAGDDLLQGGAGDDSLDGGDGLDTVTYADATNGVSVRYWFNTSATSPLQATGWGTDTLVSIEKVIGSPFNDTLIGNSKLDEVLFGGAGDDWIDGFMGADLIDGGDGNDRVEGLGPLTVVRGGAGNDTVIVGTYAHGYGGEGADVVRAIEYGILHGDAGNDTLTGSGIEDTLDGGDGQDSLSGGGGADLLIVAGADQVWTGAGADRIQVTQGGSAPNLSNMPDVRDWASGDIFVFGGGTLVGDYAEMTAADFTSAKAAADAAIAAGSANFVVVQVGADLYAFVDSAANNGAADDAVIIRSATLADFDSTRFVSVGGQSTNTPPAVPSLPAAPTSFGQRSLTGTMSGNLDQLVMPETDVFVTRTSSLFRIAKGGFTFEFTGSNFVYDGAGNVAGGLITGMSIVDLATGFSTSTTIGGAQLVFVDDASETKSFLMTYLSSNDWLQGGAGADLIRGYMGNDQLFGGEGANSLYGGQGNDLLYATAPDLAGTGVSTFLRGEEGNDYMVGGLGFDDVHGNQGEDTERGGAGDDWVVGGQGNDLLFGDSGLDIVLGNLGNDSCVGGADRDVVRGGQGNDIVWGEAGDDFLSGDRGDDTLVGGAGADTFHSFAEAGIDRIEDFNAAEGDVLNLLVGSTYSLEQLGSNTVVTVGGQAQVTLVGVQLSSLPTGWLIVG